MKIEKKISNPIGIENLQKMHKLWPAEQTDEPAYTPNPDLTGPEAGMSGVTDTVMRVVTVAVVELAGGNGHV